MVDVVQAANALEPGKLREPVSFDVKAIVQITDDAPRVKEGPERERQRHRERQQPEYQDSGDAAEDEPGPGARPVILPFPGGTKPINGVIDLVMHPMTIADRVAQPAEMLGESMPEITDSLDQQNGAECEQQDGP